MSAPTTTLTPDNRGLVEAYQRILDHDLTKWEFYPHLAALLPTEAEQSHIYLQGAWRALERGAYEAAQNLSSAAARVYGRTFRARLIDIELLKRQGQGSAIPKKLLEIAETFNQKNLPAEEVKAYKRLAILDPSPAYYQRVMILYTQINKVQKASEWASKLAKIATPRTIQPSPIHKERTEAKQPNPIDQQILVPKNANLPDIAFGKALWAKYFGDVGEEPPLPPDIDKILSSPCPIWPDKKVRETHLLVLVPQTVIITKTVTTIVKGGFFSKDKTKTEMQQLTLQLNLKTLGELVQKPLQGNASQYTNFNLGKYTDPLAPQSHWVLMSRDVIPGSRYKRYVKQQAQVATLREKTNLSYEVPTVLDAAVCILMEYVRTGMRLYTDSPLTYTRCQENYNGKWQLVVGGFAPSGLCVFNNGNNSASGGVAVLRKFSYAESLRLAASQPSRPVSSESKAVAPALSTRPVLQSATPSPKLSQPLEIPVPRPPKLDPSEAKVAAPALSPWPLKRQLPDIAFGKALWAKFFGDVGEEPPLPPDIDKILSSPCPFWPDKKVKDTHLLVLVPQTVNGQPLTFKALGELVQKPLQGPATRYRYLNLGRYKDSPAPKSHWALMSRDVIPGSRNQSYAAQQACVIEYSQKSGVPYEVPIILDATICIFMEYFRTGMRLYSDNPWTYTRCQEKYNGTWQLIVGGFVEDGLRVHNSHHSPYAYRTGDFYGIGVLLNL